MNSSYQPRLMQAASAADRMQALGEFLEFWLGPRKEAYGVSAAQLDRHSLPAPLRWLHEFAGRWPALKDGADSGGKGRILGCRDRLRPLNKITLSASGKLEFLDENQECWVCRTLSDGADPPAWCEGDLYDAKQNFVEGETLVCDSLSKFLVTFTLQEVTLGSRFILEDDSLKKKFKSAKHGKVPLWLKAQTPDFRTSSFWLWNGSLAAHLSWSDWCFAANHSQAIAFLESKQGAIEILQLSRPSRRPKNAAQQNWMLSFKRDGSATASCTQSPVPAYHVVYPDPVEATAPAGTFDLVDLHRSISSRLKAKGDAWNNVSVNVYHTGEAFAATKYLSDVPLFVELFERTLAASKKGRLKLKRLFAEKWRR